MEMAVMLGYVDGVSKSDTKMHLHRIYYVLQHLPDPCLITRLFFVIDFLLNDDMI